jgi:hypothetical protein
LRETVREHIIDLTTTPYSEFKSRLAKYAAIVWACLIILSILVYALFIGVPNGKWSSSKYSYNTVGSMSETIELKCPSVSMASVSDEVEFYMLDTAISSGRVNSVFGAYFGMHI